VYAQVEENGLPAYKLGRSLAFELAAVRAWLERRRVGDWPGKLGTGGSEWEDAPRVPGRRRPHPLGALREGERRAGALVADRALPYNPASVAPPGKRPGRKPLKILVPTYEEVDKLLATARPEARPVLELQPVEGCAARSCSRLPGRTSTSMRARCSFRTSEDGGRRAHRADVRLRPARPPRAEGALSLQAAPGSRLPERGRLAGAPCGLGAARVPARAQTRRAPRVAAAPRPAPLRRLAPDRAGRERPPRLQGRRAREAERHARRVRASVQGRARRGCRAVRPARSR
jgi:hypothetical protein